MHVWKMLTLKCKSWEVMHYSGFSTYTVINIFRCNVNWYKAQVFVLIQSLKLIFSVFLHKNMQWRFAYLAWKGLQQTAWNNDSSLWWPEIDCITQGHNGDDPSCLMSCVDWTSNLPPIVVDIWFMTGHSFVGFIIQGFKI